MLRTFTASIPALLFCSIYAFPVLAQDALEISTGISFFSSIFERRLVLAGDDPTETFLTKFSTSLNHAINSETGKPGADINRTDKNIYAIFTQFKDPSTGKPVYADISDLSYLQFKNKVENNVGHYLSDSAGISRHLAWRYVAGGMILMLREIHPDKEWNEGTIADIEHLKEIYPFPPQ